MATMTAIKLDGNLYRDENGRQPWRDSFFLECLNASGEIRKNLGTVNRWG